MIIGISGASGVIYGIRLLEALKKYAADLKTSLVISPAGEDNIRIETDYTVDQVKAMASVCYDHKNMAAVISSGSHKTLGMVVVPCSIKTLSDIANCATGNLLVRSADVTLKEGRKLVVVPRETPLHKGHLKLLATVADFGAIVLPPMPAFYNRPQTVDDIVNHTVGKILDQFNIDHNLFKRWEGE